MDRLLSFLGCGQDAGFPNLLFGSGFEYLNEEPGSWHPGNPAWEPDGCLCEGQCQMVTPVVGPPA